MGKLRQPDGLTSSYFLLLTVFIQQSNGVPFVEDYLIDNLMDLLNNGSTHTAQEVEPRIKDNDNGNMVITDTNEEVKAAPTTPSKVTPELIIKYGTDNGTSFYDLPYFDESRSPEQDIAVNYFTRQTISKLNRVKIIFTVPQSAFNFNSPKSTPVSQDNHDFDYLVNNATNILRDIPSYSKSFGLVVTKVNDSDDKLVMDGIVQFLTTYMDNLRSQPESSSSQIVWSTPERKIQFVEVLLEQDQEGKYGRIHLSRSPTECGPLSQSSEATESREGITRLYSETLEYAKVNPKDFGDTISSKSKLLVEDSLFTLLQEMAERLKVMMYDFESWHDNLILETRDLVNKTKKLVSTTAIFGEFKYSPVIFIDTPDVLMEKVMKLVLKISYNVSQEDQQQLKRNQSYLEFFIRADGPLYMCGLVEDEWLRPIEEVKAELVAEATTARKALRSYLLPINQIITAKITALVRNFTDCYLLPISEATDWVLKMRLIREANEAINQAISQMDGLSDQHYPEDFAIPLVALLDKLGCNNSSAFQNMTREAQIYFKSDEEVNPPGVPRAKEDWVAPVAELGRRFQRFEDTVELGNQCPRQRARWMETPGLTCPAWMED